MVFLFVYSLFGILINEESVYRLILVNFTEAVAGVCKYVVYIIVIYFGNLTYNKVAAAGFCKKSVEHIGG